MSAATAAGGHTPARPTAAAVLEDIRGAAHNIAEGAELIRHLMEQPEDDGDEREAIWLGVRYLAEKIADDVRGIAALADDAAGPGA